MREFEKAIGKLFDAIMMKHIVLKTEEEKEADKNNDLWWTLLYKKIEERKNQGNSKE